MIRLQLCGAPGWVLARDLNDRIVDLGISSAVVGPKLNSDLTLGGCILLEHREFEFQVFPLTLCTRDAPDFHPLLGVPIVDRPNPGLQRVTALKIDQQ